MVVHLIQLLWFRKGHCQGNQLKSSTFFPDQSTLSRCHLETDCNITIPISKDSIEWICLHCSTLHSVLLGPKFLRASWASPPIHQQVMFYNQWWHLPDSHIKTRLNFICVEEKPVLLDKLNLQFYNPLNMK